MPEALVINLDRSEDRWEFQRRQLGELGVAHRRLCAVDGASLSDDEYRAMAWRWRRPMSRNEVACLMSHAAAWREVVATGRATLVLEDDAALSRSLPRVLASLPVAGEPIVFNLETGEKAKLLRKGPPLPLADGFRAIRVVRDRGGAAAYVVTPEAAAIYLQRLRRVVAIADAFMAATPVVRRFQVDPAPCVQLQFLGDAAPAGATTIARRNWTGAEGPAIGEAVAMKGRRLAAAVSAFAGRLVDFEPVERRRVPACPTLGARRCA